LGDGTEGNGDQKNGEVALHRVRLIPQKLRNQGRVNKVGPDGRGTKKEVAAPNPPMTVKATT
jgi:hypothetical protein